ncbi:MAG: ABC transporter permease [Fimbriimonadales bacterium]|nr:MAG: ABC transporter permease [Fimbriimonadales bacterium]
MSAIARSNAVVRAWRKTIALINIYIQETLAYRAGAFIWGLADGQLALILPAVWLAAFGQQEMIGGRDPSALVTYYLAASFLSQFIVCHLMWDIGFEIREGLFSVYLLRPINVVWMHLARNVGWRIIKVVLYAPIGLLFILIYGKYLVGLDLYLGPGFWLALILAHFLSFFVAWSIALISLWTTEFVSIFRLYYFPEMFLSGRLVPLETMPRWAMTLADVSPFKYTVAFPVGVLLGEVHGDTWVRGVAMQGMWIALFVVVSSVLLKKGLKQYTGFGN